MEKPEGRYFNYQKPDNVKKARLTQPGFIWMILLECFQKLDLILYWSDTCQSSLQREESFQ